MTPGRRPAVRRFAPGDAEATRQVFVRAVLEGAAGRYSEAERRSWVPDPSLPAGWAAWLDAHHTLVAEEDGRVTGFMMLERDGYLNMAFVLPERMGQGTAEALHAALLATARDLGLRRLTVLASRYAQGFLARRGWRPAPELPPRPGLDPRQGPHDRPVNRPMALDLAP